MIHASFKARDEALVKPIYSTHFEAAEAYQSAHRALMEEFGDALAAEYLGKLPEAVVENLAAKIYTMALNFARSSEDFAQIELNYLSFAGLVELAAAGPHVPVDIVAEFLEDCEAKGVHYERGTFEWGFNLQAFLNAKLKDREWRQEIAYFKL